MWLLGFWLGHQWPISSLFWDQRLASPPPPRPPDTHLYTEKWVLSSQINNVNNFIKIIVLDPSSKRFGFTNVLSRCTKLCFIETASRIQNGQRDHQATCYRCTTTLQLGRRPCRLASSVCRVFRPLTSDRCPLRRWLSPAEIWRIEWQLGTESFARERWSVAVPCF